MLPAGIMSAYGSYAPATADIYADNTLISHVDFITSLLSGFAVFAILGNIATRTTDLAASNPALRLAICKDKTFEAACVGYGPDFDCAICGTDGWRRGGACCGVVKANNVAKIGIYMAFAVCLCVALAAQGWSYAVHAPPGLNLHANCNGI
jgi:hypothetical protein